MLVKEDILHFLSKGRFEHIPFGTELDDLVSQLGPAECTIMFSRKDPRPSVVKYDRVEFYFSSEEPQMLKGIQVTSTQPCESLMLKMNYAGIDKNARYKEVVDVLESNGIIFRESYASSNLSAQVIAADSGVTFYFDHNGLIEKYGRTLQGL